MLPWLPPLAPVRSPTLLVNATMLGSFDDDVGHLLLVADHLREADALDALGVDVEAARVLARQEPLRDAREEIDRCRRCSASDTAIIDRAESQGQREASSRTAAATHRTCARWRCRTHRASGSAAA